MSGKSSGGHTVLWIVSCSLVHAWQVERYVREDSGKHDKRFQIDLRDRT